MSRVHRQTDLPSPDKTTDLARALAPLLWRGDTLLLKGPIGAGKTHFARAMIQARLGREEPVPSPSYTLVQTYDGAATEIWHADLYRLSDPSEIVELGLEAAMADAICIIEWPERIDTDWPDLALLASFGLGKGEGERHLTLQGRTDHWEARLDTALTNAGLVHA